MLCSFQILPVQTTPLTLYINVYVKYLFPIFFYFPTPVISNYCHLKAIFWNQKIYFEVLSVRAELRFVVLRVDCNKKMLV